jgi:hypothetical protein
LVLAILSGGDGEVSESVNEYGNVSGDVDSLRGHNHRRSSGVDEAVEDDAS